MPSALAPSLVATALVPHASDSPVAVAPPKLPPYCWQMNCAEAGWLAASMPTMTALPATATRQLCVWLTLSPGRTRAGSTASVAMQ